MNWKDLPYEGGEVELSFHRSKRKIPQSSLIGMLEGREIQDLPFDANGAPYRKAHGEKETVKEGHCGRSTQVSRDCGME